MKRIQMLAAFVALGATLAFAQPAPAPGAPPAPRPVQERGMRWTARAGNDLNLTDQQKTDMAKLRIEMQKKNTPLQSQIKLARLEIQQLALADNPDRAKIEKQMKEISDLELKVKLNALDHHFAVNKILTPEQQKIWKEKRGEMFMMRGMRGNGMMGGQGTERRIRIQRQMAPQGSAYFLEQPAEPMEIEIEAEGGID
jgi:Spy/CpxP family protein refolding chaperone